jgi:predicted permease
VLLRQPAYGLLVIVTIALGVGATTTLFSVAHGVLLDSPPWDGADRLVRLYETRQGSTGRLPPLMTNAVYVPWRDAHSTLDGLAAYDAGAVTLSGDGEAERIRLSIVSASLFPMLGARPVLGRLFTGGDETPGQANVATISYGLWQRRFGGSPDVLGGAIRLDGEPYRIVGVMAKSFWFPDLETSVWIPYYIRPVLTGTGPAQPSIAMFHAIGRLREGATPAQAAAEGTARALAGPDAGMAAVAVFGVRGPSEVKVVPYMEAETATVRPAILVFLAAVGLLLLAATANVAGLQLGRATARRREMALRAALGAHRSRLVRQLLVESAVMGLAGGLLGLVVAAILHRGMPGVLPADFPRAAHIGIDAGVAAFAVAISLLTGLCFGLVPARLAARLDLIEALNEDSLAPVGGRLRTSTARVRAVVMGAQVAIACVLLVGAALLTRSFIALLHADRGFDPANVLTVQVPMPEPAFPSARRSQLLDTLLARVTAVPGVAGAGLTTALPLAGGEIMASYDIPAPRPGPSPWMTVQFGMRYVSAGYFSALRIPIVEGRGFRESDTKTSRPVVIVSREFARQYLQPPAVGRHVPWRVRQNVAGAEVIGIVEDVRHGSIAERPRADLYISYAQKSDGLELPEVMLTLRTGGDPKDLAPVLRGIAAETDRSLALGSISTMEERLRASLGEPRLYAVLSVAFGALTLLIAAVGLFGVLSYTVSQRTREIGVRTALGATPRHIVTLVARQAGGIAAAGVAVGLVASAVAVRYLSGLLYGVTTYDEVTFVVVPAAILVTAALACVLPAWRARRMDPVRALRG